jgi:hypothetical protein
MQERPGVEIHVQAAGPDDVCRVGVRGVGPQRPVVLDHGAVDVHRRNQPTEVTGPGEVGCGEDRPAAVLPGDLDEADAAGSVEERVDRQRIGDRRVLDSPVRDRPDLIGHRREIRLHADLVRGDGLRRALGQVQDDVGSACGTG